MLCVTNVLQQILQEYSLRLLFCMLCYLVLCLY